MKRIIVKGFALPSFLNTGLMIVFVLTLPFTSCKKDGFFDFAKSTGKEVTITRPAGSNFNKIFLNDDIDLVITQGNTYKITLKGGENVLPEVETSITDSTLTIRNKNTFNWVRSYDRRITAYVTMPHILELEFKATSTVTNTDTIREDSLTVKATGGSGYIDLIIKTGTSKLSITQGSADMKIRGYSGVSYIFNGSYGPIRCLGLESNFLFMRSASPNDCFVTVKYHFEYEITSLGNIYYAGNPPQISGTSSGSGKAIKYD